MTGPLVSVLVPCYDYGRYVRTCVESMLQQTARDLEVLVLDDGSTDDSWSVVQSLSALDPRVRALQHEANQGHVTTMNDLIHAASGRYVVMLGADDLAASRDVLQSQLTALERNPEAGFAYGDYELMDPEGRPIGREHVDAPEFLPARDVFERLLLRNFVPHSGTLVRAECYERLGVNDPRFHYSHDWELWLRLSSRYGAAHIRRPLYRYRMHHNSLRSTAKLELTVPEFHAVIDHAASYSPLPAARFRELQQRGHANASVLRATAYLARGRYRGALADLINAMRAEPRALMTLALPRAALSAAAGVILGRRKERVLSAVRRFITRR